MAVPILEQILKRVFGGGTGGTPVAKVGRYSGVDTEFQTLVTWTVSTGKVGDLHEISWSSDNDAKTRVQLVIDGETQTLADDEIDSPLSLPWRQNQLAAAAIVTLSVKSSDGTSIAVSGSLTATERAA